MNIENIKSLVDIEVKYIDDIKGFGVFSNQFIPKFSIVEMCYSLKLSNISIYLKIVRLDMLGCSFNFICDIL